MIKDDILKLSKEIENITVNFQNKPTTANVKMLKENFDVNSISTPNHYLKVIEELSEVLRQSRLLFVISVFNRVCKKEGKLYYFDTPYQAGMRYDAVMEKDGEFHLLDEDGEYSGIFSSENFTVFIDEQFWKLYEEA